MRVSTSRLVPVLPTTTTVQEKASLTMSCGLLCRLSYRTRARLLLLLLLLIVGSFVRSLGRRRRNEFRESFPSQVDVLFSAATSGEVSANPFRSYLQMGVKSVTPYRWLRHGLYIVSN
jgi:hypothetical protein